MKQRFSYLDLRLVVNELEGIILGCRLQNIYSLEDSPRHFSFKFDAKSEGKTHVIVDPGIRIHTTKFQHPTTQYPSGFVSKLRKHLKTRRVSELLVPAGNRLLVMSFSNGLYHLVLEFFSGGNIILLDEKLKILAVYRNVKAFGDQPRVAVGEYFSLEFDQKSVSTVTVDEVSQWIGTDRLGKVIYSKISDPSSSMIEYCLAQHGLDPKEKEGDPQNVADAVQEALDWAHKLISQNVNAGYLLKKAGESSSQEFEPFVEYFEGEKAKNPDLEILSFPTYNETVDEHFGAILTNLQTSRVDQLRKVAEARLEAARNEKENRVRGLEEVQSQNEQKGLALQMNSDLVDGAIQAVSQLLDQGMDWVDIDNLIKLEKQKGNSVAQHISKLSLERNRITLDLPYENDEGESDHISVLVDLAKSSWANSRDYFNVKRAAGAKKEKTLEHAEKAYKSAEKKIKRDLEKNLTKNANATKTLHTIRQPYWFEKFYWFLSSDNILVIGGRDDLQNELLIRRYFEKDDVLVHSDAPGAAVLIVKLPQGKEPSPQVLNQAASFCLATCSKAWDARFGGPSWWVSRSKVPRINAKGDPITVADVAMGPRNNMLPTPIDMGITFMWQTPDIVQLSENLQLDSDDEFPDTQLDSDDEFPDTQVDSEDEFPDTRVDSEDDAKSVESASPEPVEPGLPTPELSDSELPPQGSDIANASDLKESEKTHSIEEAEEDSDSESSHNASVRDTSSPQPESRKVRGKNKKLKKLRKYLDQDEEDRRAAMERLGTLKGLAKAEQEEKERQEKRAQQIALQKQHQERKRQAELDRISSETVEDVSLPTNLSGVPPKDESHLIAAVPMFAPWSSLQKAKYKVKIVPGTMKKGKATQEAVRIMVNQKDNMPTDKEKKLIEAIRPQDLQMIVPVKTMQIGGATSKLPAKNSKQGNKSTGGKSKKKK